MRVIVKVNATKNNNNNKMLQSHMRPLENILSFIKGNLHSWNKLRLLKQVQKYANKYQPFRRFDFPLGAIWIVLRYMVAAIVIKQYILGPRFPEGLVEIKVASVKRQNIQIGGTQKI